MTVFKCDVMKDSIGN